jgi:hypothetical protein
LDHIRFALSNDRHAVGVYGNVSNVVIDHCRFEAPGRGVNVFGGRAYWTEPTAYAPGTARGVYIEDCVFTRRGVETIDLNYGGAYVARHNRFENGGNIAVHGADSGDRSGGYIEVYDNVFENAGANVAMAMILRGGSATVFNNTISGPHNTAFVLQNWRSCYGFHSQPMDTDNRNRCENGSINPHDGDLSPPDNGWPCKDQIGRGPNQISAPAHEWSNTLNGENADFAVHNLGDCSDPSTLDHVQDGRDFFSDTPRPDYCPFTYPHPLTDEMPIPYCVDGDGCCQAGCSPAMDDDCTAEEPDGGTMGDAGLGTDDGGVDDSGSDSGGGPPDGAAADGGTESVDDGCRCSVRQAPGGGVPVVLGLVVLAMRSRRLRTRLRH